MEKLLLVKNVYIEAFRNWRYTLLKNYFKILSWVCLALIAIASYALIYRLSTGFAFNSM